MWLSNNNYLPKAGFLLWYAVLLFFAYLLLLITLQYIPPRTDAAFLLTKQDVIGMLHYRIAFFAHVYIGMFVLLSGMLQFPANIRKRFPAFHKWAGRVYVFGILGIAAPSGLVMGYYGNGGPISQVAFCLLGFLWILFTWKALKAAIAHKITEHKIWMYRNYALTLSAISLRAWKWLLVWLYAPRPMDVYHIVSWLGWGGNLLIAEVLIYFTISKQFSGLQTFKNLANTKPTA